LHGSAKEHGLGGHVEQSMKGADVVAVLNQIRFKRGAPKMLFCDNGCEFTSQIMYLWPSQNGVKIELQSPREATDNAYIET
jgi:putative transposase